MIELDIYFDIVKMVQNLEVLEKKVTKIDDDTLKEPLETMVFLLKAGVATSIRSKNAEIMKFPLDGVPQNEIDDSSTLNRKYTSKQKELDEDALFYKL